MSFGKDVKTEIEIGEGTLTLHAEMELKAPVWDQKRLRYVTNPDLKRYYSSEAQSWLLSLGHDITGVQAGPRHLINHSDETRKVTWVFSLNKKAAAKPAPAATEDSAKPEKTATKKKTTRRKSTVKSKTTKQEG